MRLALALILVTLGTLSAGARPVVVTSGEHKDFTRIVLQFDGAPDWSFGRTLDGYALRVPGQKPDYDLARAFDLIGKSRLAALAPDPQTGDLQVGIGCACYAIPFEFRPGIVVIDLYDGAPPKGASFEQPLPALTSPPAPAPASDPQPATVSPDAETLIGGYDWTRLALQQDGPTPEAPRAAPVVAPTMAAPNLVPLRLALAEEMGRGATAGLIELTPPPDTGQSTEANRADNQKPGDSSADQSVVTHLGQTPDLQVGDGARADRPLTATGGGCVPEAALDIAAWGSDRPVAEQLGPIRQGMIGEFDRPDADALRRVIRFYLYIGFGAEARSLMRAYPDLIDEAPILTAMAHLIDGEPDETHVFKGMEDCDTPAALWAVLSDPGALPGDDVGRAAVARNFSALPAALRRLLGPTLVKAFLTVGDIPGATALSEAVLRAPGDPGPAVVMMQAEMSRALGHNGDAEAKLEPLANGPGPSATDALVDLVEHRAMLGQTVSDEDVLTLQAALKEREGGADAPRYRRALVLAKAASGDFDAAFAETEDPGTTGMIWKLLAQIGGDTPLLTHATLGPDQPPPPEAGDSAGLIADRLLMLGLADQAARWLVLAPKAPDLLKARVALANGDAVAAIDLVKDDRSEQAMHLKAQALADQGDLQGAAKIYEALGKSDQQWASLSEARSWDQISQKGPDAWKSVAGIVTGADVTPPPDPTQPSGPLALDKQLVGDSASTRDAITSLLNSVQVPGVPSQ